MIKRTQDLLLKVPVPDLVRTAEVICLLVLRLRCLLGDAFLSVVSTLTCDIDKAILYVRPSVAFQYSMETA